MAWIHYSFDKGTIYAKNCQAKWESDEDSSITRELTVYIELRRTLGGIGYASFGEKIRYSTWIRSIKDAKKHFMKSWCKR